MKLKNWELRFYKFSSASKSTKGLLAFHTRGVPLSLFSFSLSLFLSSLSNFSQSLIYDEQFSTIVCTVTSPIRSFSRWLHVMLESRARVSGLASLYQLHLYHRPCGDTAGCRVPFRVLISSGPFTKRGTRREVRCLDASHDYLFRRESEMLRKFYGIFAPRNVVAQDVTILGLQPLIKRFPFFYLLWDPGFYGTFQGSYSLPLFISDF